MTVEHTFVGSTQVNMGKERLPDPGFYVEWYGKANPEFIAGSQDPSHTFSVIYISPEKTCKYIHWSWGDDWTTLTWTCAPTRKKIAAAAAASPDKDIERYYYFPTHQELCRFPWISQKPGALTLPA